MIILYVCRVCVPYVCRVCVPYVCSGVYAYIKVNGYADMQGMNTFFGYSHMEVFVTS